jgi:D-arabinose 1-dehydrogenase-like Zn-dependent alcohol dehydrogenase
MSLSKIPVPFFFLCQPYDPTLLTDTFLNRYCYKIPENYPLALAAPLLCSGITVYTPMIHYKMNQPGKSLGVIGLGGLGQMAVKFGKAFGLNVTVFSTSICKKEEALNVLGADKFIVSTDEEEMKVEHPVKNLSDHLILRFPTSNPMFHY